MRGVREHVGAAARAVIGGDEVVADRQRLGAAYMTAIAPFRHLLVYPALTRDIAKAWR